MEMFLIIVSNFIRDNKADLRRFALIIGSILIILYLFDKSCSSCTSSSPTSASDYSSGRDIDAYLTSKRVIEKILKAPSTAKFQSYDKAMVSKGDSHNVYVVSAYVDSQNSYGAMLRARYTVTLRWSADGWKVEGIIFNGERMQ